MNGKINSITSPFLRFKNDFVGLEQGCFYCVTSYTKGGKTQFVLFLLFEALLYIMEHPDAARMKVLYFALEENDERILQRFESYLLLKLDKIRISPRDLRSTSNDKPVPKEILDLLASEKYQRYIRAFEEHFEFSTVSNPTGIYKMCRTYAENTGVTHYKTIQVKSEFGEGMEDRNVFDFYTQNDPNEFRFVVCDHISLIASEKGMTIKESVDKLSKYFVELRNRYNFSPIVIQQQSTENESNDSFKLKNIRPSARGLSDSKYVARDVNCLLGLFSPYKFGLGEYMGYDITLFKDRIRFFEVCLTRDGEVGGLVALYFDGATSTFRELPLPDSEEIKVWYKRLEQLRDKKQENGSTTNREKTRTAVQPQATGTLWQA